jgi:ABC-type oligopeptide transport system ATPase subunit
MVRDGTITIGELTSFLMYTAYAGSSLFGLSSFYSELMKGVGAASRLFELQDREPTISPTVGDKVVSARGPIRFENLSFSYPTRPAVTIFQNLDFEIPQGKNVAIVGPSGGGKSTIASLLLRFYSPTSGRILINGNDIATMNAKSLRRRIGIVAQEPVLFSGSIAENIAYGKPNATRQEIIAAARKANCQFISDFVSYTLHSPPSCKFHHTLTHPPARRPRHLRRRPRSPTLWRPKTTHRHRPRSLKKSRHPHPRRSDLSTRRRIGNTRQLRARYPHESRQHHHLHRPPSQHDQAKRHHYRVKQ